MRTANLAARWHYDLEHRVREARKLKAVQSATCESRAIPDVGKPDTGGRERATSQTGGYFKAVPRVACVSTAERLTRARFNHRVTSLAERMSCKQGPSRPCDGGEAIPARDSAGRKTRASDLEGRPCGIEANAERPGPRDSNGRQEGRRDRTRSVAPSTFERLVLLVAAALAVVYVGWALGGAW